MSKSSVFLIETFWWADDFRSRSNWPQRADIRSVFSNCKLLQTFFLFMCLVPQQVAASQQARHAAESVPRIGTVLTGKQVIGSRLFGWDLIGQGFYDSTDTYAVLWLVRHGHMNDENAETLMLLTLVPSDAAIGGTHWKIVDTTLLSPGKYDLLVRQCDYENKVGLYGVWNTLTDAVTLITVEDGKFKRSVHQQRKDVQCDAELNEEE